MEDLLGEIVTAVVVALAAAAWRKIESGRLRSMLRAVIEGVETASREGPTDQAALVKRAIKDKAEQTGAQARLHSLVEEITKEST